MRTERADRLISAFAQDSERGKNYASWMETAITALDEACQEKNITELPIIPILGPQGAGKGTIINALTITGRIFDKPVLTLDSGLVVAGTGGVCKPEPGSEYDHYFSWMGPEASKHYNNGSLVPSEYANPAMVMMMVKRVEQGAKALCIDGWPRNAEQMDGLTRLHKHNNQFHSTVIDLRIMNQQTLDWLVRYPNDGVMLMQRFGASISHGEPDKESLFYPEYAEAMRRAEIRLKKKNRSDDKPETMNRRLAGYYSQTAPEIWKALRDGTMNVQVVSAQAPAGEVAERVGRILASETMNMAHEDITLAHYVRALGNGLVVLG